MAPSAAADKSKALLHLDASLVVRAHTYLAGTAFLSALVFGCALHYKKIVKNAVAGYPDEWFPSVSATIGDWYPERNIFQILIALAAGPRFALVIIQYLLTRSSTSSWPTVLFLCGILRTLLCGGWVYITSSDDHDVHDVAMIGYIVCNLPWMLGTIALTPSGPVRRRRILVASGFFGSLVPLVYLFIQHKVHRVKGAYTYYAFVEWSLIFLDVAFDAIAETAFRDSRLQLSLTSSLQEKPEADATSPPPKQSTPNDHETVNAKTSKSLSDSKSTPTDEQHATSNLNDAAPSLKSWRLLLGFISDIYLSYVFWSIFTSLLPTLFYFSVWELGIAGHELAVLSTLSPIILSFLPFHLWAKSKEGIATLQLLSFAALTAFLSNRPATRVLLVAPGTAFGTLAQVLKWTSHDGEYQTYVSAVGFLLSSLSRLVAHSNNPIWPNVNRDTGGHNVLGLCLALLALSEYYFFRPPSATLTSPNIPLQHRPRFPSLQLGALLFTLHSLFTNGETVVAWSWTGFTNRLPAGPEPIKHGFLTLLAQCLGLLLPLLSSPTAITNPIWFALGSAATYVMYTYRGWIGYSGGLGVACFTTSLFPIVLRNAATTSNIGHTYFKAFGIYIVFIVLSTFTVAYAFVPGGQYLRERTDLILMAQVLALLPVFYPRPPPSASSPQESVSPERKIKFASALALISILSVVATLYRLPVAPIAPFKPGPRIVTAGIWTLHFGMDNQSRDSQRRVHRVMKDLSVDIIGLLESDLHRPVFGNRDLTRYMASEMGYYVDIGPGPNTHTWGAALLSKFPIINSTHHLLPSPHGELAPAIEAVLDIYGTEVTVVVAHNGQEEDPLDRELQSTELARIMNATYPDPVIFLGYVVSKPHAKRPSPYEILVTDGQVHDIDKDDQDRWCEYILYRSLYRTSYARISRGLVTDTELQIGQFVVPKYGELQKGINDTSEARYLRSRKEKLPVDHWMPMEYYRKKGGVNGHRYHVFGTPLYYQLPDGALV